MAEWLQIKQTMIDFSLTAEYCFAYLTQEHINIHQRNEWPASFFAL